MADRALAGRRAVVTGSNSGIGLGVAEALAAADDELDAYLHLALLNRGYLMTPFHNMALMCPASTQDDVDGHTKVFAEVTGALRR